MKHNTTYINKPLLPATGMVIVLLFCMLFVYGAAHAQNKAAENDLFSSDTVLSITIRGDIRDLVNDRDENAAYHPLVVAYADASGKKIELNTEIRTRGHFRKLKENCRYPPLLINFRKSDTLAASIFKNQDKTKLVVSCSGDEYVVQEYLAYKIYNLFTPISFRARLVNVTLDDTKKNKATTFYGILLEEEKQMARRNGLITVDEKLKPAQTQRETFLEMAIFEYLIANTDWSVEFLQNIKLVATDSTQRPFAVPYDFDHAGIVNAPYAAPAEELHLSSIRERRYRGFCIEDMSVYDTAIAKYNSLKNDIYAIYRNCTLLSPKYVKSTLGFLDEFYETINDPAALKKAFGYPCDPNGTGNVIIKGLKQD